MRMYRGTRHVLLGFTPQEVEALTSLTTQLELLLNHYLNSPSDPDPFFAKYALGGNEEPPEDPALLRLFPDVSTSDAALATSFRQQTERSLVTQLAQVSHEVQQQLTAAQLSDSALADRFPTISADTLELQCSSDFEKPTVRVDPALLDLVNMPPDLRDELGNFEEWCAVGAVQIALTDAELLQWSRVLTALTLTLAARLDVTTPEEMLELREQATNQEVGDTVIVFLWLVDLINSLSNVLRTRARRHTE